MRHLLMPISCCILILGCSKIQDSEMDTIPNIINVSFEDDATRIQLNEDCQTVWNSSDTVSVFYKNNGNGKWYYQGGDMSRNGFLYTTPREPEYSAILPNVYAIYPYNPDYTIDINGKISLTIPPEQQYLNGSYGEGCNIMVAVSPDENIRLKNVFGWIRIKQNFESVEKIIFRGLNNETLAGPAIIDPSTMEIEFVGDGFTELVLDCQDLQNSTYYVPIYQKASDFCIAIPPQVFENGFEIEILGHSSGSVFTYKYDKRFEIKRNCLYSMAQLGNDNITFADDLVKKLCVDYWDVNNDGELSRQEAAFVTDLGNVFNDEDIQIFDELQYFTGLKSLTPNAFARCNYLTSVVLPETITSIEGGAFYDCTYLERIVIPQNVTTIGNSAFYNCKNLHGVIIPETITHFGEQAFWGCAGIAEIVIGENIATIGQWAFVDCAGTDLIVKANIPNGTHNHGAFYHSHFKNVTISDGVTSIGSYAFEGSATETLVISDSVLNIGEYAFQDCMRLQKTYLGTSVKTIEQNAFEDCTGEVSINSNIEDAEAAYYGAFYESNFGKVMFGSNVTKIPTFAFYGCRKLLEIIFHNTIMQIGEKSFYGCTALTSINLPQTLIEIGDMAFRGCNLLARITIPDSVTSIGYGAFDSCTSLKEVYCKPTIPPTGDYSMFSANASERRIYVPASDDDSIINAYKVKSGWATYSNYIYEYDFSAVQ